ncbi:hypothetical protein HGRIS_006040 [Hohenbuehelia grisea]|uniref:Bud22 domain-containing protein n=1 Tax=Hohenbuehelia grisea TaxID=104357 RepID=A0ABR3JZ50_9AGAR
MAEATSSRGTKRKRYEPKQIDLETKLARKLHHELKEVRKVAKKAKTFETQKLVKRLKQLRNKEGNDKEISETEAQIEALKHLDLDVIANSALRSKLKKDGKLSHDDHFQIAMAKEFADVELLVPGSSNGHAAKVENRLLSSKIIAAEVTRIVTSLKVIISPEAPEEDADDDDEVEDELTATPSRPKKARVEREAVRSTKSALDGGASDLEGEEENEEGDGWESGSVDEENNGEEETGEDDGWESGTVGEAEDGWESGSVSGNDSDDDIAISEASSADDHSQPAARKAAAKKPAKQPAASSAANSQFLPSLSVGFIRGSDDSDLEGEAKITEIDTKKNRRGQRARRAIWEKKYGRNANHKKKEQEEAAANPNPKQKWGASAPGQARQGKPIGGRRPSEQERPRSRPNNQSFTAGRQDTGWPSRDKAAGTPDQPQPKPARAERPLHPSWEAKRKQQSAGIVPSAGKKIVF